MRAGHWLALVYAILVSACAPAMGTTVVPSIEGTVPLPPVSRTVERSGEKVADAAGALTWEPTTPTAATPTRIPATAAEIPPPPATSRASATSTPWFSPTPRHTSSPTATSMPTSTPDLVTLPGHAWNMELVGHDPLESRGWWASMGLHDTCAYIGSYAQSAVAIVDVSDPENPRFVGSAALEEAAQPVEVRAVPELDLLVVADLRQHKLFAFDISDCIHPKLRGSIQLPGSPHEFFLWHDGSTVLAYAALFDDAPPALVVVDLTDPIRPQEVARWSAAEEGARGILHSLSVSLDGRKAYLALWDGGLLVAEVDLPQIRLTRDPQGQFSAASFAKTHSAVPMDDPRYILLASEVFPCPFNGLALADISDAAHPRIVSEFKLPENRCTDLPPGGPVFSPHNPTVVGNLVFASWYSAGVQAIDWSDPLAPRRVGQFVPLADGDTPSSLLGDYPIQMFSYPILRGGLIYVVDSVSGLYILQYTGPGMEEVNAVPRAEGNLSVLR